MHFGRVESLNGISLGLPPDPVRTEKFLSLPREGNTRLYIGCPIWASKEWLGDLYPRGTPSAKFLQVYSQVFNAVEVNSTFYTQPDAERVERWREDTTLGFRFCPKVFRGITEAVSAPQMPALVTAYCKGIEAFREKLGLVFAQFSEHFGPEQVHFLTRFLDTWPQEFPLAVELRHPAWFQEHALRDEVINLFYKRKISTVITDTAGQRKVLHFSLTQPKVLIRFQGNEGHEMDEARLHQWGERIRKWQQHSLEEVYFFSHQPGDKLIPQTARMAVKEITGQDPPEAPDCSPQLEIF